MAYNQMDVYGDSAEQIFEVLSENSIMDENRILLLNHVNDRINKKLQLQFDHNIFKGKEWLNTKRGISLDVDCGQKLCVLDFFTFCCINCTHILPYLDSIEKKYGNKVSVIGIHSPKFTNEKDLGQVRKAVLRNNIRHPVLNDPDCFLWSAFGITCWPTVFLVGPDSNLLFVLIGEQQIKHLDFLCELILDAYYKHEIELDESPLPVSQEKPKETEKFTDLLYPGNISTNGKDLIVSDTGHHRLILMSSSLEKKDIIGSGIPGCDDGSFEMASFNSPHGTTWFKGDVYVADTGNHCIRKVSFANRCVSTVFKGTLSLFRSPWDICLGPSFGDTKNECDNLYIAVAGSHQIWKLDLNELRNELTDCIPFAGSGKEENRPNTYRLRAGFSQPSGITYSQTIEPSEMYIADTESSTIKCISLENGSVRNICGGGLDPTDLFQFGDKDGRHRAVRLQHPMGICVLMKHNLIIADTYNHKIKIVNVREGTCRTIPIPLEDSLNEPSSICTLHGSLFIADTNNNRIVKIPIKEIMQLIFQDLPGLELYTENVFAIDEPETIIRIQKWGNIFCHFCFSSDKNLILNESAPQKLDISFKDGIVDVLWRDDTFFGKPRYTVVLQACDQPSEVTLSLIIGFCDKDTCSYKKVHFKFIVDTSDSSTSGVNLMLRLAHESKLDNI